MYILISHDRQPLSEAPDRQSEADFQMHWAHLPVYLAWFLQYDEMPGRVSIEMRVIGIALTRNLRVLDSQTSFGIVPRGLFLICSAWVYLLTWLCSQTVYSARKHHIAWGVRRLAFYQSCLWAAVWFKASGFICLSPSFLVYKLKWLAIFILSPSAVSWCQTL